MNMENNAKLCDLLPTILEDKLENHPVYHYTSIEGFLKMMENIRQKKCYLFAGNMMYQNDSQEFYEGIECLDKLKNELQNSDMEGKKVIEEAIQYCKSHINNNIYISCFSSQRDLLEQWKYYGKNSGLSIEFNFMECEGFWDDSKIKSRKNINYTVRTYSKDDNGKEIPSFITTKEEEDTQNGIALCPVNVIYKDNKLDELVNIINSRKEVMKKLPLYSSKSHEKDFIIQTISAFIPICKNHFFEHEKESRLLFFPFENTPIRYRQKNGKILPFICCTVVNKDKNKYPVKSITVGPGADQELVFNAVINYVEGIKNKVFFKEEDFQKALKKPPVFEGDLTKIGLQELGCFEDCQNNKSVVYRCLGDIFIYKSPIPFRD